MKCTFQYKDLTTSVELSPDEIKKLTPSFFRSIFRRKEETVKACASLVKLLWDCQTRCGWKKFVDSKPYLKEDAICIFLAKTPWWIGRAVKTRLIDTYKVSHYADSNIFFAAMELFISKLNRRDIQKIFDKYQDDDQAALWPFLELIEAQRPKILFNEALVYLRDKQREWQGRN